MKNLWLMLKIYTKVFFMSPSKFIGRYCTNFQSGKPYHLDHFTTDWSEKINDNMLTHITSLSKRLGNSNIYILPDNLTLSLQQQLVVNDGNIYISDGDVNFDIYNNITGPWLIATNYTNITVKKRIVFTNKENEMNSKMLPWEFASNILPTKEDGSLDNQEPVLIIRRPTSDILERELEYEPIITAAITDEGEWYDYNDGEIIDLDKWIVMYWAPRPELPTSEQRFIKELRS